MAKLVQRRRGTTVDHVNFIGAVGEITVDTTKNTAIVHDGSTVKGFPLALENMSNVVGSPVGGGVGITQLNVNDGSANQLLSTDGFGNLSFATVEINVSNQSVGGDVTGIVSNIQIRSNVVGVNEIDVLEGSLGQVLTTDGNGGLTFTSKSNVSDAPVGGDVSGTISNIQINANAVRTNEIIDNAVTNSKLAVNSISTIKVINLSITADKLSADAVSTIKIVDGAVTNAKIDTVDASKLTGALPAVDGSNLTNLPYDTSFAAGYDTDMVPEDLVNNGTYAEMVMSRNGTFVGEVGHVDVQPTGSPLICDILKNGVSIYSTKPQFAISTAAMTPGIISSTSEGFLSGDTITFKVTQIGSGTAGRGLRFTLNGKGPS